MFFGKLIYNNSQIYNYKIRKFYQNCVFFKNVLELNQYKYVRKINQNL